MIVGPCIGTANFHWVLNPMLELIYNLGRFTILSSSLSIALSLHQVSEEVYNSHPALRVLSLRYIFSEPGSNRHSCALGSIWELVERLSIERSLNTNDARWRPALLCQLETQR